MLFYRDLVAVNDLNYLKSDMSQDDHLQQLINLLLKEVLPSVTQALTERDMSGHRDPLVGSDAFLLQAPDKLESLTKQILDELGTKSELRDSRDILAVVGEELSAVSSSEDYKNALSKCG